MMLLGVAEGVGVGGGGEICNGHKTLVVLSDGNLTAACYCHQVALPFV